MSSALGLQANFNTPCLFTRSWGWKADLCACTANSSMTYMYFTDFPESYVFFSHDVLVHFNGQSASICRIREWLQNTKGPWYIGIHVDGGAKPWTVPGRGHTPFLFAVWGSFDVRCLKLYGVRSFSQIVRSPEGAGCMGLLGCWTIYSV